MAKVDIFNGDALEFLKGLPDGSVDLILSDPPYNIADFVKSRDSRWHTARPNYFGKAAWDDTNGDEWSTLMAGFLGECARVVKAGGNVLIFTAWQRLAALPEIAESAGLYFKTVGVWHKTNPTPRNMGIQFVSSTEFWIHFTVGAKSGTFNCGGKCRHNFIELPTAGKKERVFGSHPTQKPVRLMGRFIETLSDPGDLVCDPFMGSGSTGVAAVGLDRDFAGSEIDPNYFATAEKRLKETLEP